MSRSTRARGIAASLTALAVVGAAALSAAPAAASPGGAPAAASVAVQEPPLADRADFIFFPMTVFVDPVVKEAYYDYLKGFDVCLSNGYAVWEGEELDELQAAGCEFFIYRWFNGYYESELDPDNIYYGQFPHVQAIFHEINAHPEWLLNPGDPQSGSGAVYPAYFYDYMNPEFREFFVDAIVDRLDESGYNGVFFDYIGGWALPPQIIEHWNTIYPDTSYDEAAEGFLAELRAALGEDRRIFGNQAYRLPNAHDIYQHIDYDVTESYGTTFIWGAETDIYVEGAGMTHIFETFFRPWDGEAGYRSYIEWPRSVTAGQPVEFFEINYLQARYEPTGATAVVDGVEVPVFAPTKDRHAVYYGYALSSIMGIAPFASDWYSVVSGLDDVYFTDLGEPVEESYRELDDQVIRYFENGFVVVSRGTDGIVVEPDTSMIPAGATLWDSYASAPAQVEADGSVVIGPEIYEATGNAYPSGRVFLYAQGPAPACDVTLTGTHTGGLVVSEGITCLDGAAVKGGVTVEAGASLVATASTIRGGLTASGAASLTVTGTEIKGGVKITTTAGPVALTGNTITGATRISDNAGGVVLSGNTISGSLQCSGNLPAPSDGGDANRVTGAAHGQCGGW